MSIRKIVVAVVLMVLFCAGVAFNAMAAAPAAPVERVVLYTRTAPEGATPYQKPEQDINDVANKVDELLLKVNSLEARLSRIESTLESIDRRIMLLGSRY